MTRGHHVAAREGGLRRGQIGLGEIALAAIGHGQLAIGLRRFRLAQQRAAQEGDRFLGEFRVVGAYQGLRQHDLDQRRGM